MTEKPRKYRCKVRLVVPTWDELCDVGGSHVARVLGISESYYDACYIIEVGDTFDGSMTPYGVEYHYIKLESTDNTFGFYLWEGTLDEYFEEVSE